MTSAQNTRINLEVKNSKLRDVIWKLDNTTSLNFFYNTKELEGIIIEDENFKNTLLSDVIKTLLKDTKLEYSLIHNTVVIRKTPNSNQISQQKERVITGTIKDENGATLPGVNVIIKGTALGKASDINGKYKISIPTDKKVILVFSFIGMKKKEIVVNKQSVINVVLISTSETIDEVVVTGITSTDKRLFTGAADKLQAKDIKMSGIPEIGRSLEGRSAGVSVQNVSGTFGTAPKIRVRGATSIYGNSKPLWVVDGVPLEDVVELSPDDLSSGDASTLISSAISGLNPDDIESFQILKDGSATSIYGAKAMAGVIVITTKKGRSGVSRISYSSDFTMRLVPRYSEFNIMNSQDQMGVYQEMEQKGWLKMAELTNSSSYGVYGKMYQLINSYNNETGQFGLRNTPESKTAYLQKAEFRNTDWFDVLFKNSISQSHAISMSGGNKKSRYYASLSALIDPGWSVSNKVNRYTANINASYNIFKNLDMNIITNGSFRKQTVPGTLSQTTDEVNGSVKRDFDINPYSYAMNSSRTLHPNEYYRSNYAPFNILNELKNNYIDLKVSDVKFQSEIKYKPISGMEVSVLGAVRYQNSVREHHTKDNSNQAMAYRSMPNFIIQNNNPLLYKDPDKPYDLPMTILPEGGIYTRNENQLTSYNFRTVLRYNKTIKDNNIINFNGGMEITSTERQSSWFNGWGMQYEQGEIPYYTYQIFKKGVEENNSYYGLYNTTSRNTAFFANLTYSWRAIYNLSGTIRYEGSNKLGKSRSARWLPTWNISGSWNVYNESFFEQFMPTFSHLTLKASYSLTADSGPSYVTNSSAVIRSGIPWRPTTSVKETNLYISQLENSSLTYEKKHELNIGASLGFLDDKINLEADWYSRKNYDLIGIINVEGVGGENSKWGNVAEMESNGLELSLSTKNIITPNFSWTSSIVYSHIHNKITKLHGSKRIIDLITNNGFGLENYPVRSIFSYRFKGLDKSGFPTVVNRNGDITSTDIYFQSRSTDYLKYEGPSDPTDMGSIGNIFNYKGFKLNVFITYSWGNVVRLRPIFKYGYTDLTAMTSEFKNRWIQSGDENITNIPVILSSRQYSENYDIRYGYNAYNYCDLRIAKGDFVRMKEISLTYNLPSKFLHNMKVNSCSIKLQASNLFLIYADKKLNGQDPEFINSGGVATPIPKQFTLSLHIGL